MLSAFRSAVWSLIRKPTLGRHATWDQWFIGLPVEGRTSFSIDDLMLRQSELRGRASLQRLSENGLQLRDAKSREDQSKMALLCSLDYHTIYDLYTYCHFVIYIYIYRISYPYAIMCVVCLHLVLLAYVLGAPSPRRPGWHFWARVRNQRVTFEPPVYPKTLGAADMFFTESVLSHKHIQDDRSMRWLQADQGVPM